MPLAHILAPQLERKVREIQAERGAAPVGYLQMTAAPARERPLPKPTARQAAGNKKLRDALMKTKREQYQQLIPPAAPAGTLAFGAPGEQIGLTERGEPIYAPTPPAPMEPAPRKKPTISAKRGEAAGFDERGESVDIRGRKLGYLKQGPTIVTPRGDLELGRHADRRRTDIVVTKDKGLMDRDAFGASALKQLYGEHAEAASDTRDDRGIPTDELPRGYFDMLEQMRGKPVPQRERENIKLGIKALQELNRGTPM